MHIHTVEFWTMTFAKNETMNNLFLGQWLKRSVLKDARSRPSAWHLKSLSIPDANPCRTDKTKTTATERNNSGNSHLKGNFLCVVCGCTLSYDIAKGDNCHFFHCRSQHVHFEWNTSVPPQGNQEMSSQCLRNSCMPSLASILKWQRPPRNAWQERNLFCEQLHMFNVCKLHSWIFATNKKNRKQHMQKQNIQTNPSNVDPIPCSISLRPELSLQQVRSWED